MKFQNMTVAAKYENNTISSFNKPTNKTNFFLLLLLLASSQIVFSDKINLFNIKIKTNLQQPSTKN